MYMILMSYIEQIFHNTPPRTLNFAFFQFLFHNILCKLVDNAELINMSLYLSSFHLRTLTSYGLYINSCTVIPGKLLPTRQWSTSSQLLQSLSALHFFLNEIGQLINSGYSMSPSFSRSNIIFGSGLRDTSYPNIVQLSESWPFGKYSYYSEILFFLLFSIIFFLLFFP